MFNTLRNVSDGNVRFEIHLINHQVAYHFDILQVVLLEEYGRNEENDNPTEITQCFVSISMFNGRFRVKEVCCNGPDQSKSGNQSKIGRWLLPIR